MIDVRQTDTFKQWLSGLRDRVSAAIIARRIRRLEDGNFGDVKSVGDRVSELRIDCGPGFRVYLTRRGQEVVILLCGGDKSTQARDIATAKSLLKEL